MILNSRSMLVILAAAGWLAQAQTAVVAPEAAQVQDAGNNGTLRTQAAPAPVAIQSTNTNTATATATAIPTGQVIVNQPTTYVEASPLGESRAERLRRERQDYEVQTEQKIVEKLEQSRLQDERDRADRLFGEKLEKKEEAPQAAPVYQNQQMPVQQVVVPAETDKKVTPEDLTSAKQEIIEAIQDKKADASIVAAAPVEEKPKQRYFITGMVGTSSYYKAVNVEGRGAGGFMVGAETDNHFIVEGGLLYANYLIQDDYYQFSGMPLFKELDQYNIGVMVKYSPLPGRFKPMVGVGAGYTYRKYFDRSYYTYGPNDEETTSNAVDLTGLLGLELGLSDSFALGVEYRYSGNLFHNSSSDILNRYRAPGTRPVEEAAYSSITINGKVRF